jgi:hypothetical protein
VASTTAGQFLAKPTTNPLEVMQDPRVLGTGAGVLAGHTTRKLCYTQFRNVFGHASKEGSEIKYYADNGQGQADTTKELQGAYVNRILLNVFTVVAGTLLIGVSDDANVDYIGLGLAAGGTANVIMTVLNID